jgi:integrase/recombinase XerD
MERDMSLISREDEWVARTRTVVALWADATSRTESTRIDDIRRDKRRALDDFFSVAKKRPGEVTPEDVAAWRASMEARGLAPNSIYTRLSLLSSFYTWAANHLAPADAVSVNPVRGARPKRPRSYQSESTHALTDTEVRAIVQVLRAKVESSGSVVAKRDLALFLWFILTGMRRAEVISLRGRDVDVAPDRIVVRGRVKGGLFLGREIRDATLRSALLDYLETAGRLSVLGTDGPLWTRHDKGGVPGLPLASHSFVSNLKRYATEAGLDHIHLHQTRHTFARVVSEETGSLLETQDALGHQSASTTRVYVQRIAVKRDKHSSAIADRFL